MGMNMGITDCPLAIVTMDKNVKATTCPVFYVENEKELQNKAMIISKTMGAMVHDILNGTLVIVKH